MATKWQKWAKSVCPQLSVRQNQLGSQHFFSRPLEIRARDQQKIVIYVWIFCAFFLAINLITLPHKKYKRTNFN